MESTSYVLSFRLLFFYLVTTGWLFDISLLCENSINQSIINQYVERNAAVKVLQLHQVGGMKSTGTMVQGCLSPGTAFDLTRLLVCVRCEV